jgi:tetratricopeptide (TPR) repeat protein
MTKVVAIAMLCLLVSQVACFRRKSSRANESQTSSEQTQADNTSKARSYLDRGKEFYRNDEDEKALEAFQEAVKLDPQSAEAHFRLGLAYNALNQEHEAEEAFKKAVEAYKQYFSVEENEQDFEAHYNLAQAYAGLHLYSEAVREYRKAVKLKEDDADVYYDLGLALTRLAQYDDAAGAFEKSLEIDPSNYRAEDALEEAREGVKRIRAGKKHQEDLLKKQKEDELKKQQEEGSTPGNANKPPVNSTKP